MPRTKKVEKKVCNQHTFALKPESAKCYYQSTVIVKMCLNQGEGASGDDKYFENCYEGPVFNHDHNLAMPSFVLNSEKVNNVVLSTNIWSISTRAAIRTKTNIIKISKNLSWYSILYTAYSQTQFPYVLQCLQGEVRRLPRCTSDLT